jgi:hypothetical protein
MSLSRAQVEQLLKPIAPERVLKDRDGLSHVSQQDVRAHLNRIFGFTGWSTEIVELKCVRDDVKDVPAKNGKPARTVPAVTYLCRLRLVIQEPPPNDRNLRIGNSQPHYLAVYEDVGTGTSPNLPDYGDAHDFAAKNAVSYALKRCATNLGDQFGLSLYNKGQTSALVRGTLVMPEGEKPKGDVQEGVERQVDMGDERPAEHHDTDGRPLASYEPRNGHVNSSTATVKAQIWNAAKAKGWSQSDLEIDFASSHEGLAIGSADETQLAAYAEKLVTA